jgi:hypothetical protein
VDVLHRLYRLIIPLKCVRGSEDPSQPDSFGVNLLRYIKCPQRHRAVVSLEWILMSGGPRCWPVILMREKGSHAERIAYGNRPDYSRGFKLFAMIGLRNRIKSDVKYLVSKGCFL